MKISIKCIVPSTFQTSTSVCLAVIDFKYKKIEYYDSLDSRENEIGAGQSVLENLLKYLVEEAKLRKYSTDVFTKNDWKLVVNSQVTPQQQNFTDCGVCVVINTSLIVYDKPLNYGTRPRAINKARRRMLMLILNHLGTLPERI